MTLKKIQNIRHEEKKKKDKQRTGSLGLALPTQHSSTAATSPSIPTDMIPRRWRGDGIRGEQGQGGIGGLEALGELF